MRRILDRDHAAGSAQGVLSRTLAIAGRGASRARRRPARLAVAALALAAAALALVRLAAAEAGAVVEPWRVGDTPAQVWRPTAPEGAAPAVVVAHGFAGSKPLMRAFAAQLARAGYVAVTFDFLGHGRHPAPLTGDVNAVDGATAGILGQLRAVAAAARALPGVDGRLALLGHSMAGDVIVRLAAEPAADVTATVGVSMYSQEVTAAGPGNLLLVAGAWERGLTDWALEAVRDVGGAGATQGATYGDMAAGSARRAVAAPSVEHIGVLWSRTAIDESIAWLDAAFGRDAAPPPAARTGGWVLLLIGSLVALAWPLAALLPRAAAPDPGAGLSGRRFWLTALAPAAATPVVATALDVRFLPMVVGDYLALHFALYGGLTLGLTRWLGGRAPRRDALLAALPAALAAAAFALGALGWALDAWVSTFRPEGVRWLLLAALLPGAALYMVADERLTRAAQAPRLAYPATKALFLLSLAAATALDLERLFFLVILTPALVLFFVVYGLFSRWTASRTGGPLPGALANALVFAWAIAVTFPMLDTGGG